MSTATPAARGGADEIRLPPRRGRRRKHIFVDLFCGAGLLSKAVEDAAAELGMKPTLIAVNHWDLATQTFQANHPEARVYCQSLETAVPELIVPEGYADLLVAGIECTFFSRARGGKPVTDQQRSPPWAIQRWCAGLRVRRFMLENVPEFVDWGPVDPSTGRPVPSKKGMYFRAWWDALLAMGYRMEMRKVMCADHGDATTRVRLLIKGVLGNRPITWAEPEYTNPSRPSLFGAKPWRPAREIIDWSQKGTSIFTRERPLAPATLQRILAGVIKYGWPWPFIVILRQHMAARSIDLPLPAVLAAGGHLGLAEPFLFPLNQGTERTRGHRSVSQPTPTITATGTDLGLVQPFLLPQSSDLNPTRSTEDPIPTLTTVARVGLVEPFVLSNQAGGAPRGVSEPIPGIVTKQGHALIAPFYGSGSGETCSSTEQPLPTATTKGRFGLVMPVTHADGGNRARSLDEPLPTVTGAHRGELGFVMPVTHSADGANRSRSVDEPLVTITAKPKRGELAFVTAAFGERQGQDPRTHSIDDPTPTICATGRVNLVQGDPVAFDILFRMLQPHELAAAMSAPPSYVFLGNKTQVTRLIGQAVPYRTGKAEARALLAS